MDDKTETQKAITDILNTVRGDLADAKVALSRLDFTDEVAKERSDTENPPPAPNSRFGMISLPIHYTLGQGVPEALGGHAEEAVFSAFHIISEAANNQGIGQKEFDFRGTGVSAALYWDKASRFVCLHLELVHTDQSISLDEWNEVEREVFQDRSLN